MWRYRWLNSGVALFYGGSEKVCFGSGASFGDDGLFGGRGWVGMQLMELCIFSG